MLRSASQAARARLSRPGTRQHSANETDHQATPSKRFPAFSLGGVILQQKVEEVLNTYVVLNAVARKIFVPAAAFTK
jgi:hypothetical protein